MENLNQLHPILLMENQLLVVLLVQVAKIKIQLGYMKYFKEY